MQRLIRWHDSILLLGILGLLIATGYPNAAERSAKNPGNTYPLTDTLIDQIKELRKINGIVEPWDSVPAQSGKEPRHVLRKAIEILEKINRLRILKKLGPITIPPFPIRQITPDEVYLTVDRLIREINLLLPPAQQHLPKKDSTIVARSADDIYQKLWEISLALDPLIDVRGVTENDIYIQTEHILALVNFLRTSQKQFHEVPMPTRTSGKYPNHELKAAHGLLEKIAKAQWNLWLTPTEVPTWKSHVVSPIEVHDALQNIIAELHYIQYRLGLERYFIQPASPKENKVSDDIIQNLTWAGDLMPLFAPDEPLYQYSMQSLQKSPKEVLAATQHIYQELESYRAFQGIMGTPPVAARIEGLSPKHSYYKTLESFIKINHLRRQMGLGEIVVPDYPSRLVTPTQVYELVARLDDELHILYDRSRFAENYILRSYFNPAQVREEVEVAPSDVYQNVTRISRTLDMLANNPQGYSLEEAYQRAEVILHEVEVIARHQKRWSTLPPQDPQENPALGSVLDELRTVLAQIFHLQYRAGISDMQRPAPMVSKKPTMNDLFEFFMMAHAELVSLKIYLGIQENTETFALSPSQIERVKTLPELSQVIHDISRHLAKLLGEDGKEIPPRERMIP